MLNASTATINANVLSRPPEIPITTLSQFIFFNLPARPAACNFNISVARSSILCGTNGGYDATKLSDEEIIDFANDLLQQIELISYKYKKK